MSRFAIRNRAEKSRPGTVDSICILERSRCRVLLYACGREMGALMVAPQWDRGEIASKEAEQSLRRRRAIPNDQVSTLALTHTCLHVSARGLSQHVVTQTAPTTAVRLTNARLNASTYLLKPAVQSLNCALLMTYLPSRRAFLEISSLITSSATSSPQLPLLYSRIRCSLSILYHGRLKSLDRRHP